MFRFTGKVVEQRYIFRSGKNINEKGDIPGVLESKGYVIGLERVGLPRHIRYPFCIG